MRGAPHRATPVTGSQLTLVPKDDTGSRIPCTHHLGDVAVMGVDASVRTARDGVDAELGASLGAEVDQHDGVLAGGADAPPWATCDVESSAVLQAGVQAPR